MSGCEQTPTFHGETLAFRSLQRLRKTKDPWEFLVSSYLNIGDGDSSVLLSQPDRGIARDSITVLKVGDGTASTDRF